MAGAIMFTLTITPVRYSRRGNPRQVYNVPFRAYVNLAIPTRSPASTKVDYYTLAMLRKS